MDSLLPFLQGSYIPYNMPVYPGARRKVAISDKWTLAQLLTSGQSTHPEWFPQQMQDRYRQTPFASRIGRAAQFRCGSRISPSALSTHSATFTAGVAGRWDAAIHKPFISDLCKLARFFKAPITALFPGIQPSSR
jgi:hypothetical protein